MAPAGGGRSSCPVGPPAAAHRHLPLGLRPHPARSTAPSRLARRTSSIYDEDDRLALVKECDARAASWTSARCTPSAAVHRISHAKNQMIAVTRTLRDAARAARGAARARSTRRYEKRLRAAGGVDFDDLLAPGRAAARDGSRQALAWYRGLWSYVLVDEYQDTNRAQYRIIQLLTERASQRLRASATATSRSTSGAAPTSATSSTSRRTSRQPRSCGSSRTIARPSASSALAAAVIANNTSAEGQDACGPRTREGDAGPASTGPGTSTRRPASSPSPSAGCAARACRGTTSPSSTGPTRSRACWRTRCAAPASPT